MAHEHFSNKTKYMSVSNEDGHAFIIGTGHDFEKRWQAALNEHFDGDCVYSADAFETVGIDNNFIIEVEVMQDGGETIYKTQVEASQTWVY